MIDPQILFANTVNCGSSHNRSHSFDLMSINIFFFFGWFLKMPKSWMDASKERLRLQAIDQYRNRKSWASRPGIQLPTPDAPTL